MVLTQAQAREAYDHIITNVLGKTDTDPPVQGIAQ